ncbi:MAG: phosphoenolpyruvate carboxykinase (GTP), partial [Lentisphaerae bacterium]|nr:phosphoenolpyruvate carboxykinase (GTP) [Lentisphaerota bacterium]
TGAVGVVRHDPMAMLPFCGYNMGDYLRHWLAIGQHSTAEKLPKIFYVNWFRKSSSGQWLWPGYGENIRVLKWIYERVTGEAPASISPIGQLPLPTALDTSQLKITPAQLTELLRFDKSGWQQELIGLRQHYARLGDRLPTELREELAALARHLDSAG